MSLDQFVVRHGSREADFLSNYGVNKGYTIAYSKVSRCYLLSASAKQLYQNLCAYAWGGNDCWPSQITLRSELGWSRATFDGYLDELRNAGMVTTANQGPNRTLLYTLTDLSEVPLIKHSEMIHQIRTDLTGNGNEAFYRALRSYMESDLYARLRQANLDGETIRPVYEELRSWFQSALTGSQEPRRASKADSAPKRSEQPGKPTREPHRAPPRNLGPRDLSGVSGSASLEERGKRPARRGNPEDPETWTATDLYEFFAQQYTEATNQPYLVSVKDRTQMKRLLESSRGSKQQIKDNIKLYVSADYFEIKTIAGFCSMFVQSAIDAYHKRGSWPKQGGKAESKTAIVQDYAVEEDEFKFSNERGSK
ncbi:helix-turn-helix domain-containing protein [Paenibacillus xylanexedens]|uniref:helix-turn-helix domain-containing protein n=1 Tax=Paenibacillus xylanexedens TaxID=528191 RepID=UPI001643BD9B|nr:helix-turn-helix domain-containing protein [Paenibacillus xylanexedens]